MPAEYTFVPGLGKSLQSILGAATQVGIKDPTLKMEKLSLAGVTQWIECQLVNQKVAGLIPSQGTCLGCGPGSPVWGHMRGNQLMYLPHIDVFLPLFLPPFPSLYK